MANIPYETHAVTTLPTTGKVGDVYLLQKPDNRYEAYIVKPNGTLVFNKGITDNEQARLDKFTVQQADKLIGLKTQEQITADISIAVDQSNGAPIKLNGTVLPQGNSVPSVITVSGMANLYGGTGGTTYTQTGGPSIEVSQGKFKVGYYDRATNLWSATTQEYDIVSAPAVNVVEQGNANAVQSNAVYNSIKNVSDQIAIKQSYAYTGVRPYRFYTADATFVTDRPQVEQTNGTTKDTFTHNFSSSGTACLYYNTGVQVDSQLSNTSVVVFEFTVLSFIALTNNNAFGFGWGNSTEYKGFVYRNRLDLSIGDTIALSPFSNVGIVSLLPAINVGDIVRFEVSIYNKTAKLYKNNILIATLPLPTIPTSAGTTWQVVLRGGLSVDLVKIYTKDEKYAPISVVTEVNKINTNYPFIKGATFISDFSQTIGQDRSFVKGAIKDIKLYGADVNKKYSIYAILRNSSNTWRIDVYEDTGIGNGTDKVLFSQWTQSAYQEPTGIDIISNIVEGVGFKLYIDWSKIPIGSNGSITYNAAGLDQSTLINFNTSSVQPQPDEDISLSWQYNNTDAVTTGTSLFKQYTVVSNVDSDGDVLGCTGASYNKDTDEYVISYYSFAKASKLWFFKRRDLIDYSSTGTIIPKPTREIDVSNYIYHIQGNVYDPESKTYWILGSLNPVSNDLERLLIRVDEEGNQLERHVLSNYSFQAGMIALSPDLKNLLIKPNNRTWLLELNKYTLSQVRQVTTVNNNEGLGVDYVNGIVWIGGDNGNLYRYRYSDMVLLETIPYQSLPNPNGSQNVEGLIVDIDGALINVADAYLHGENNNGNCMWVYDFSKTIGKYIKFPEMMTFNINKETPIIDFNNHVSTLQSAVFVKGSGTIEYRGSNEEPTLPVVIRDNWRDLPYYVDWGEVTPSEWSTSIPNNRYVQLRIK